MSEKSPVQGHAAVSQQFEHMKINRSSSVHCDVVAVIDKLSDEEWIILTNGMQDMTRLDFIEMCLGIISQIWKATFKKFVPVVIPILEYHVRCLEDSQLPQGPSDAANKQGLIRPSDAPFVRTLRGQIRQEVKKALVNAAERISRSSLSTGTFSTGPGADWKVPVLQLELETLKVLAKRLNARKWAATSLTNEEELQSSKTKGITKKVVIAVLTLIQSSCLHCEHLEATTVLLRAIAKRIKRLACPKNKLQVGFALEFRPLKKMPPLLLTADFKTKASKSVLLVLLQHVKCPLLDYTPKQPSLFTCKAEKMALTKKCPVLPYIVTADSLTTGMVDTVLETLLAVSEISEENIALSATNMFSKVQHKIRQFVIFHKEIEMNVRMRSECGGPVVDMESEMNLAAIECVDDAMTHLNDVSGVGRSNSPEQLWCIAKHKAPTPDDSLVTRSSTKSQRMPPQKVRGMSCIVSCTDKKGPKTSAKDLKLEISASGPQLKQISEGNSSFQGLEKQETGQMKRISLKVRLNPKKPAKDFYLTAAESHRIAPSYRQSSNANACPREAYCDKMAGDHNNTAPQTKYVKQTLRIHEAILKEHSLSTVKILVSDVIDFVLMKDPALPCPCAYTVETTPASSRIAEPDKRPGRSVVTAFPASARKEAWVSQTPLAIAETEEVNKMGQAEDRLEHFISSGILERFAIDLTKQLCHLLKKNTCQRCRLQAGRSLSHTALSSLQRENNETADSSFLLKNAYKFVEKSVRRLLHQMLCPSHPIKEGDSEDLIQGIPSSCPCTATEAHGDPISPSHTLDEIADLVKEKVMKELMRVFSQMANTHAQLPCSSKGSHFADEGTKPKVAGTVSIASSEVDLAMPCKGKSSKVAACTDSSVGVTGAPNTNPCAGKKNKRRKKNRQQKTQWSVSQGINRKRLSQKNAVLPILLTPDTNSPVIKSQQGHLQEYSDSVATGGNSNINNNRYSHILSDAFVQGQGSGLQDSTFQQIENALKKKPKKRNIFARFFSSISKSVQKCLKKL